MATAKNYYANSNMGSQYINASMSPKMYGNTIYSSAENNMNNSGMQYSFKERSGKLKWKEIMKLDLEGMIRTNDLTLLENYLENLIFASIDENDLQMVPETSFLKLIKIYQYITEYLLFTQQRLENENKILDANYTQLVNDSLNKETQLKENKSLIHTLKKDKKEKEMVLNTYKCLIDEYKAGKLGNSNNENTRSKKYFYCKICDGKKFSTQENLQAHMERRHFRESQLSNKDQSVVKDHDKTINEKFEDMKTFFETYIKNFHNDSYLRIFENQKNLESKITEVKYEKNNEIREIENQFKSTLIEMKEMYLKNSLTNIGNAYVPTKPEKDHEDISEITKKELQRETSKMNEMLMELNKQQNEKIFGLMEQLVNFKQTISEELKSIKEIKEKKEVKEINLTEEDKKERKKEKKKNKIKNKIKEVDEENDQEKETTYDLKKNPIVKEFKPAISHIESLELNVNPPATKNQILIRESAVKKSINKTKVIFNAGPLESDDESDNEMILKNKSINMKNELRGSEEVKFSFAPNNVSLRYSVTNNAEELAPTANKQENNTSLKNSIIENLEKDIENIPQAVKPSNKRTSVAEPPKVMQLPKLTEEEPEEIVKSRNVKKEIEKDKQIEIEKEKEKESETNDGADIEKERVNLTDDIEKFYHSFIDRDESAFQNNKYEFYAKNLL